MKKFDRITHIDEIRDFVRDDAENGGNRYYVVIDNRDGSVVLMSGAPKAQYYAKIGKIKTSIPKLTIKNVNAVATEIRNLVRLYNRTCLITYGRAVSEYGRKNVTDKAFVREVDNPYYSSAAPMKLYDKNVIEYHMTKTNNKTA